MKQLVSTNREIPWLDKPSEGRLYITDELPPAEICGTAFGFAFDGERILLSHLKQRGWDIPGGRVEPGETPAEAAVREVWEETYVRVEIVELIGIQELELFGPRPEGHRWPYPLNTQIYHLCRVLALEPFQENAESIERKFFAPAEARSMATMRNHAAIYEEALRRVQARHVTIDPRA